MKRVTYQQSRFSQDLYLYGLAQYAWNVAGFLKILFVMIAFCKPEILVLYIICIVAPFLFVYTVVSVFLPGWYCVGIPRSDKVYWNCMVKLYGDWVLLLTTSDSAAFKSFVTYVCQHDTLPLELCTGVYFSDYMHRFAADCLLMFEHDSIEYHYAYHLISNTLEDTASAKRHLEIAASKGSLICEMLLVLHHTDIAEMQLRYQALKHRTDNPLLLAIGAEAEILKKDRAWCGHKWNPNLEYYCDYVVKVDAIGCWVPEYTMYINEPELIREFKTMLLVFKRLNIGIPKDIQLHVLSFIYTKPHPWLLLTK